MVHNQRPKPADLFHMAISVRGAKLMSHRPVAAAAMNSRLREQPFVARGVAKDLCLRTVLPCEASLVPVSEQAAAQRLLCSHAAAPDILPRFRKISRKRTTTPESCCV
jgi:hypothetical protein